MNATERIPPTTREALILDFIADHIANKGFAPTVREVCDRFKWSSTNSAAQPIHRLVQKGWLRCEPGRARTMQPVRDEA